MAMSGSNSSTPELRRWIVLIGIDYYLPGSARFDDNNRPMVFTNLQGCVRDVRKVQDYFRMQPTADTCRITTFTSSNPQEESTNRPTYENIVQSLKTITYEAEPGDIVHIHYSGHGARVWTSYRGRNDLFTAAIVPLDIAREEGKYLLTDELSDLLDDMVDKRLNVTMVLDSCYSGKSDRHRNHSISGFRGISQIDATESSIHPRSTIQVAPTQSYELSAGRGCKVLLDMQKGYELLTACRNNETASEHNFAGEHHGLLTYNLLDSLKCSGSNFTHGMLHRRLVILVNQINPAQTPVFAGESQRFFLSSNRVESQLIPTISIKHIEGNNLILGAGEAQGMFVGAEMPVYPWDTSDFNNSGLQPKVRVIDVNPTESKAKCIEPHIENCQIQPGSLAVPPKSLGRRFAVKLLEPSMSTEKDMFDRLKTETESSKNLYSPVKLIPGSSGNAAYHIRVDNDQYRLLNTANEPIRGFPSSALPELFFNYLEHLAQYEILRDLQSPNEMSEEMITKFKFELEVEGSVSPTNTIYRGKVGTRLRFKFENTTRRSVYLTIFDFQPTWGIRRIFPTEMDCSLVEAKESLSTDSIELYLPDDWDPMLPDPVDCFKAFITSQTTSFNTLELPELVAGDTPAEYVSTRGNYWLEQLLGGSSVPNRHVRFVPVRQDWWVTAEIKVCTISQGTSSHPMKMTLPEVMKKQHLL